MSSSTTTINSSEINVTFEDQQKINRFARLNAKADEIKEELKVKANELSNTEDALKEIELISLTGDAEVVSVLEGEVFVDFGLEEGQEWVEEKKAKLEAEQKTLSDSLEQLKHEMSDLKVALYSKFGKNNINLEAED